MGPGFESLKVHQWPVGQVVKTAASHAVNIGSNPVRVTNFYQVKKYLTESLKVNIILLLRRTVRRRKSSEFLLLTFLFKEK